MILKHQNPCGSAVAEDITAAYDRAFACDPKSAFGGIIACNREVPYELVEHFADQNKQFVEVIIAPSYTAEALERIKPLGYTADASNANSFSYEETVVVFDTPDQRVYAEELIDALGCGRAVQNTDGEYVYDGDFLILIGSDWQ